MGSGTRRATFESLQRCGIIAVVRSDQPQLLVDTAKALVDGGVEAIEITFTVPRANQVIEEVASQVTGSAVVGAGTVLDAMTARVALFSGAQFIVSPILDAATVRMCHRYDALVIPGAFTPTEVARAWQMGVDAVKIFPADVGGPRYLKALRGPLPQVRLVPTGGVTAETARAFLEAGAWCLAAGGSLVPPAAIARREWHEIRQRAEKFRAVIDAFRRDHGSA